MSSKINIQNLFHILHPFWIHHTKTWILLSKQYTHLQMAIKHCTKFQVSLISHKGGEVSISYFILSTPLGSTITQRKVIESSCPKICTCTNDNEALYKVIQEEKRAPVISHPTPLWIHQNSKKMLDPLILPIQTSTNDNEASQKVSSLYDQPSQRTSEHKLFHTLQPSWIHHNSENKRPRGHIAHLSHIG